MMTSQSRAAVCEEPGEATVLKDLPLPTYPACGALVKEKFFHVYSFAMFVSVYACVSVHSIVVALFNRIRRYSHGDAKVGDRVLVFPWVSCDKPECRLCMSGFPMMCKEGTINMAGCATVGGYSTYVPVLSGRHLIKCPDTIPLDVGCILPCSGLTAYNGVSKARPFIETMDAMKGCSSCVINGAGGLGLWALQFAKATLPVTTKIICVDIAQEKLDIAKTYGADDTVLCGKDSDDKHIIDEIRSKGYNSAGVDAIIDFVCNETTATRNVSCLTKGGVLVCVGLYGGGLTLTLSEFSLSSLTIIGIHTGSMAQLNDVLKLASEGKVKAPPITHYRLEDVNMVMDSLRQGTVKGRAVIKHS